MYVPKFGTYTYLNTDISHVLSIFCLPHTPFLLHLSVVNTYTYTYTCVHVDTALHVAHCLRLLAVVVPVFAFVVLTELGIQLSALTTVGIINGTTSAMPETPSIVLVWLAKGSSPLKGKQLELG